MLNDLHISPHFRLLEFEDPGTQMVKLDSELVVRLEALRDLVGKPITVTSGFRTPETNRFVGGAGGSYHLRGMAADVIWDGMALDDATVLAKEAGFTGIGIDRRAWNQHLHVDVRLTPAYWEE